MGQAQLNSSSTCAHRKEYARRKMKQGAGVVPGLRTRSTRGQGFAWGHSEMTMQPGVKPRSRQRARGATRGSPQQGARPWFRAAGWAARSRSPGRTAQSCGRWRRSRWRRCTGWSGGSTPPGRGTACPPRPGHPCSWQSRWLQAGRGAAPGVQAGSRADWGLQGINVNAVHVPC